MNIQKLLDRLNKVHKLIKEANTGTPIEFAGNLNISRSQLYNVLEDLKDYGAPIKYSKKSCTFFYERPFHLEVKYSLTIILDDEQREIFAGFYLRPSLLDGSNIYL